MNRLFTFLYFVIIVCMMVTSSFAQNGDLFCTNCGTKNKSSYNFCVNCGQSLDDEKHEHRKTQKKQNINYKDGLSVSFNIYSFNGNQMRRTYDEAYGGYFQYLLNTSEETSESEIMLGIGYFSTHGDPYYNVNDFSSNLSSTLSLLPVEFALRTNYSIQKNSKLFLGVGVSYFWVWETLPGIETASGRDLGIFVFGGPEFQINKKLGIGLEGKWFISDADLENNKGNYILDVDAFVIRTILTWYY